MHSMMLNIAVRPIKSLRAESDGQLWNKPILKRLRSTALALVSLVLLNSLPPLSSTSDLPVST